MCQTLLHTLAYYGHKNFIIKVHGANVDILSHIEIFAVVRDPTPFPACKYYTRVELTHTEERYSLS